MQPFPNGSFPNEHALDNDGWPHARIILIVVGE